MITIEILEPRALFAATAPVILQTNLVSDNGVSGTITDANLINPWGLSPGVKNGMMWFANIGSWNSTIYNTATHTESSLVVDVARTGSDVSMPTGIATNPGKGFVITSNGKSAPANFIFVSQDGGISAWAPSVDLNNTVLAMDNSDSGSVYTGDAVAKVGSKYDLYVANFNSGQIEVYNDKFAPITTMPFTDPNLPTGYGAYNVAVLGGNVYVSYAVQDDAQFGDVPGVGNGIVDVFSTKGKFVRRLASGGNLNSPWGMAIAPKTFGSYKGDILVGNSGDGLINVFSTKGKFVGELTDSNSQPIVIDGLRGLYTGNGLKDTTSLFFTAGPNDQTDGLFGTLTASKAK